jgi:acetyl-CoA carboxylase biotin carboxyl carrier protein
MDLHKLKMLIDLVAESNITELEVTEGEEKIKIVKGYNATQNHTVMLGTPALQQMSSHSLSSESVLTDLKADLNIAATNTVKATAAEEKIIKSPMVGTFYAASGPDKADFVSIGTEVKANQTVCIIEAMKLLNEIEAGIEGTIVEILVKNGMPVEFGQALFRVT